MRKKLNCGLHIGSAIARLASHEGLGTKPLGINERRWKLYRIVLHDEINEEREDEIGAG